MNLRHIYDTPKQGGRVLQKMDTIRADGNRGADCMADKLELASLFRYLHS